MLIVFLFAIVLPLNVARGGSKTFKAVAEDVDLLIARLIVCHDGHSCNWR
ncbi:hypothetical protein ACO2I3_19275 [Leptospira interrogans]